jgi:hypothetical protein
MPSLNLFSDFQKATRDVKLTGPEELLNEATSHNYILGDMLRGRKASDTFRGGSQLTERIMLAHNQSFQRYKPGDPLKPKSADTMKSIKIDWRFSVGSYGWHDEEILLNHGDPEKYVDLKMDYEQQAVTSIVEGMEAEQFARPNRSKMEGADADTPYSIPCYITEDGLAPVDVDTTTWSTVLGVNPATETRWRNQVAEYNHSNITDPDATDGLFAAFDKMFRVIRFNRLNAAQFAKYWESDDLRKMAILTNGNGVDIYKELLRKKNNRIVISQGSDPTYEAIYDGYPIRWVEALDTAALYGASRDTVASAGKPRYYLPNFKYLYQVFHEERYFTQKMVDGGTDQPFSHVMYINTYNNLPCRSRRRQGFIGPINKAA